MAGLIPKLGNQQRACFAPESMEFSANSGPPGTEIWRRQLLQIPTVFGRLSYLSSLWDAEAGRYRHALLRDLVGGDAANRTLRHIHHQVFFQWIASSLEEQKNDLDEYLRTAHEQDLARDYRGLVPPAAREVEKQLYLADLETLFALIRFERDAELAAQAASRHR